MNKQKYFDKNQKLTLNFLKKMINVKFINRKEFNILINQFKTRKI